MRIVMSSINDVSNNDTASTTICQAGCSHALSTQWVNLALNFDTKHISYIVILMTSAKLTISWTT